MRLTVRRLNRATLARSPDQAPDSRETCVQRLAWRYLEGFGPASAADVAQFTLLTRSAARDALDAMSGQLERHQLSERAWQELAEEARALVSFLAARDPAIYRRFAHWWKGLPAAEVRLLPA